MSQDQKKMVLLRWSPMIHPDMHESHLRNDNVSARKDAARSRNNAVLVMEASKVGSFG